MWDIIDEELAKKQGKKKGEVIEHYVKELTALGRTSVPEDVAKLVSFLGSSDSNFVTGQTQGKIRALYLHCNYVMLTLAIVVDGGIIFT